MITNRELYRNSQGEEGYIDLLPPLEGIDIVQLIRERQARNLRTSLLDLGCGEALFPAKLVEIFPDLEVYGLSSEDWRYKTQDPVLRDLVAKVDYQVGDAHKLNRTFPNKSFTFITAVFAFSYFKDRIGALAEVYRKLEEDGALLIDNPNLPLRNMDEAQKLQEYWVKKGIVANIIGEKEQDSQTEDGFFKGFPTTKLTIIRSKLDVLPLPFIKRQPTKEFWSHYALDYSQIG